MDMQLINFFMLAICSPVFLAIVVLIIRLSNKQKTPGEAKERRKHPRLRSFINILMALLIVAAVIAAASLVVFIYSGYMLAQG
jgi:hypothetical protein